MKRKVFQTYLYSAVGVAAMLVTLVAFNAIAARAKQRVDLTADRAYTLSEGTRKILAKLDTPVAIRFYYSRSNNQMPVFLKSYAQRVEDLLGEYRQGSKGLIEIQKLDPLPDSDAEDSAKLDGVEGQMTADGERIYLGLSVSMLDQKEAIAFLGPDRERLLEYDLSRAISRVMTAEKPVIGLMSPLQVAGQPMSPMLMQMGRRGEPSWAFYSELQRDFTLKPVEMTADSIPADIKVLLLIHPKAITDSAQYAIDQFVLRGGKLVAFLDPMAALDRQGGQNPMMGGGPTSSNLEKLLKAWGLSFDSSKVVADLNYMGRNRQGREPAVLALDEKAVSKDDVLTSGADNLFLAFAGAFSGTPAAGLKQEVLLKSSTESQLIETFRTQGGGEQILKSFQASGTEHPLAIRLSGKFKTAFPEGKPKAPPTAPGAPGSPGSPQEPKAEAGLKESALDSAVVLIGDSDMIQDQVAVRDAMPAFGGQRLVMPANGNLAFAQGAVEQLAGDNNLIAVRSRASRERPFTVVKSMQASAEANSRSKIKELETSLSEAQLKLSELQRSKAGEGSQKYILSPEQQQEIANFRQKESEVRQQLKLERKKLRADIDSLENRLKWVNIAGMPLVVTFCGVALAMVRRKRRAAR